MAAAKTAYVAYLQVVDDIGRDGGADIERMRAVTTGEAREMEMKGFERYSRDRTRAIGTTKFDSVSVQRWSLKDPVVSIYVCEDISDIDVVDATNVSVVGEGREDRLPFVADFQAKTGQLLLARKRVWQGSNFCD